MFFSRVRVELRKRFKEFVRTFCYDGFWCTPPAGAPRSRFSWYLWESSESGLIFIVCLVGRVVGGTSHASVVIVTRLTFVVCYAVLMSESKLLVDGEESSHVVFCGLSVRSYCLPMSQRTELWLDISQEHRISLSFEQFLEGFRRNVKYLETF